MKLREGQTVQIKTKQEIKSEFSVHDPYDKVPYSLHYRMKPFFGRKVTIRSIFDCKYFGGYRIYINEDGGHWVWHSSLFVLEDDVTEKVHETFRKLLVETS